MNNYKISSSLNPNRVFILQKSKIENRLDPAFYLPEFLELEKKVLAKNPKKLRDYVKGLASGATPKRDENEKYYSDKENGIPFLRVQNITEFGFDLSDVKFINQKTHNEDLKRSQIKEGDLVVTITGRLASAAVAPDGFVGNTNQHSAVIQTANKEISKMLSAFLNSSIGQKLAKRLGTGGTRPALDYSALLSIPIIEDKRILEITNKAIAQKQQNEAKAEKLLSSIDDYLLNELGIKLPEPPENTLKRRMFVTTLKRVSSNRFDPFFHQVYFDNIYNSILTSRYETLSIRKVILSYRKGIEVGSSEYLEEGIPFVRVTDIDDFSINLKNTAKKISTEKYHELSKVYQPQIGEILYSKDGSVGLCTIVEELKDYVTSGGILRIVCNEKINNYFLKYILSTKLYKQLSDRVCIGTVIKHLTLEDWLNLPIPIPPLAKQKEIADHISGIREEARRLQAETKALLQKANEEIEAILLN